jgi:hypothetical protein
MTSWIVVINREYPQHWEIAARHGFWDMTGGHNITEGDDVYFWQAGGSLVSHTVAMTDAVPLQATDRPWEDSGERQYTHRFHFRVLSDKPRRQPRWTEVAENAQVTPPRRPVVAKTQEPTGEAWLREQFEPVPSADISIPEDIRVEVDGLLGHDLRERALRAIALRQGQPAFRSDLMSAYAGTCAVTGYRTESVLEAAHISPYLGGHTNVVTNGLLLRADIHTLFDRLLLTVAPDYTVRVAPELADTPYAELDGRPLAMVPEAALAPDPGALTAHNEKCLWLASSEPVLF